MFKSNNEPVDIKAGWVLTVSSWENDLDAQATYSKHFTDLDTLRLELSILRKYAKAWGNVYDNWGDAKDNQGRDFCTDDFTDEEIQYLLDLIGDPGLTLKRLNADIDEKNEVIHDSLSELAYEHMGSSENYACRVLDSWAIHEIKQDVSFEAIDSRDRYSPGGV